MLDINNIPDAWVVSLGSMCFGFFPCSFVGAGWGNAWVVSRRGRRQAPCPHAAMSSSCM